MTSLLEKEQKKNEKAKSRIVGLTLETRPDFINPEEIKIMRELGCTKVELGVQSLDNGILKLNQRGHSVNETIQATKLLKQAGFKVCYHMMLNLYGSTPRRDLACFKKLFSDPQFQPDLLKIYPTVVTKNSGLYRLWREKKYRPYSKNQLTDLIIKIKRIIPPYVRIIRIIRDIPSQSIIAGSKLTNLRQLLEQELKKKNIACQCIRCREAKDKPINLQSIKLIRRYYVASGGQEYFLSYESKDGQTLYAFCRLRLQKQTFLPELKNAALVRELHTYGQMVPLAKREKTAAQHLGLGKKLMIKAEKIARQHGFKKMAVIAGLGVREYYRRLGYRLKETYMVKVIASLFEKGGKIKLAKIKII
jgi:elongator complex protein 3